MAKRYYIGKLPDIRKGDSFPTINLISDTSLSGWTVSATITQVLGLVNRKTLTVVDISPTEKRINSFIEDIGNGSYALKLVFTSPGNYKTTSFEGSFNIVKSNKEVNTDEQGTTLNFEIVGNQVIDFNITLGGGGSSGPVSWDDVTGKPDFANVATSGEYEDLEGKPDLFSGNYEDLSNKPDLFSGSYNDLTNKPTIPEEQVNSDWNALTGKAQILNKPTIPAAQVNADWNSNGGVSQILNKPTIQENWFGTQSEYDAVDPKDPDVNYYIEQE